MDESFNEDFCIYLEYHLGAALERLEDEDVMHYWCDGIAMPPDNQLNRKHVNDTRKIITKAWMGKTGQDQYAMTIKLGKYSLRRYAKRRSIMDCVPLIDTTEWITVDVKKKTIELRFR